MQDHQKYFLIGFNILFLIIGISAGTYLVQQNTSQKSQAAEQNLGTIYLDSDITTTSTHNRFTVSVKAVDPNKLVAYANIKVKYDPQKIRLLEIKPGGLFSPSNHYSSQIDNISGLASYQQQSSAQQRLVPATGSIAILLFEALSPDTTTISIEPSSALSSSPNGANLLKINPNLAINIQSTP